MHLTKEFSVLIKSILATALLMCSFAAYAEEKIVVAVSSNFIEPFREIAVILEKRTGIRAEPVFSSSGKLYAQIINGAPYDVFLSADEEKPVKLHEAGLAGKPVVYAKSEVVLWIPEKNYCTGGTWKSIVLRDDIKKISIANIETAPYGVAAMKAMLNTGIDGRVMPKLVYAQDINQSFQYAITGSVDAGFCALSSALSEHGKSGCYFIINEAPAVVQYGTVLRRSKNISASEKILYMLLTGDAHVIKKKFGYK